MPRSPTSSPAIGWWCPSTSPAGIAHVLARLCSPSARQRRFVSRTRAPRCSATRRCTGRSPGPGRVSAGAAGPVRADHGEPRGPDERYLFLSDILPTAWQAVQYADVPDGGVLAVFGLGPVGQFAGRIGAHLGHRVIGIDPVPERRAMAARHGIETVDPTDVDDVPAALLDLTGGYGPHGVIDAVGMEAHGGPARRRQIRPGRHRHAAGRVAQKLIENVGVDRLTALHNAHRGGASRWNRLDQRRLRRRRRPDADDGSVRQADTTANGPVQCQELDLRPPPLGRRPVGSARRARPDHPPPCRSSTRPMPTARSRRSPMDASRSSSSPSRAGPPGDGRLLMARQL